MLDPTAIGLILALIVCGILSWQFRKWLRKRALRREFRRTRAWGDDLIIRWAGRGWIDRETADALPRSATAVEVFFEWLRGDTELAGVWQMKEPITETSTLREMVADAWNCLSAADRERQLKRLRSSVEEANAWWGGAEKGWNARPLTLLAGAVDKKSRGLPLQAVDDLTGAPMTGPVNVARLLEEAEGPDLVLALAMLRRMEPRFMHPLAPPGGQGSTMLEGLSVQVGSTLGSRIGAGLGAALGPIGSMVGAHLGGMVGQMGGQAVAGRALPTLLSEALSGTESALNELGALARGPEIEKAVGRPEEAIIQIGGKLEYHRERRAKSLSERLWPTPGHALCEEGIRHAQAELRGHRAAASVFLTAIRKADPAVAGGMLLQNPWMVRDLPGGAAALTATRQALNRAAIALKRSGP